MRWIWALSVIAAVLCAPAQARDSLGVFDQWGAFRDAKGPRCYAIAEPARTSSRRGNLRAFASVGTWPKNAVRGQVYFHLSRERADDSALWLSIGERRFALLSGKTDAWAQDKRMDAAIVAAMRSSVRMSVEGKAKNGRSFYDIYTLKGAATAMDAAALGCAK